MEHSYRHRFKHFLKTIEGWHRNHRATSPGTTARLRKRFENHEYQYHKHIAEYRKTNRKTSLDAALKTVDTAEKEFKLYAGLELLGTLSK